MALPTENQVNAALRHVGTSAATATTIFVMLGFLNADQAQGILAAMQDVVAGLQQAFGGFSKIAIIIGPVFATMMATYAAKSGSAASLVGTLLKMAHKDEAAKTALVNATTALPEVEKVVAPALAPNPATSSKVTTQ